MKNSTNIPAGLLDEGVEFFVYNNELHCLTGGKSYIFKDFPARVLNVLENDMLRHPDAIKALAAWENLSYDDQIRQYGMCRFGNFDSDPDFDADGNAHYTEYFDCGLRGQCRHEGKLCCSIKVENGHLTRQQIEILKRIDKPYKLIADELFISEETVSSHIQNIQKSTGLRSKTEMAVFAAKKGII